MMSYVSVWDDVYEWCWIVDVLGCIEFCSVYFVVLVMVRLL